MSLLALIRKLWPKWILLVFFWTVLGLAFAGQLYLSRSKIGQPVTWSFALERALADWYVFAILSVPALWMARRFPLASVAWKQSVTVHLVAGAAFGRTAEVFCGVAPPDWLAASTVVIRASPANPSNKVTYFPGFMEVTLAAAVAGS